MPTSMPVACEVYYKLRTEKIQESKLGATLSGEDSNALLEGKQNIGDFAVDFDPANELYDLFYRPLNENGQGPAVRFNRTIVRATLDAALNTLGTLFKVTVTNIEDANAIRVESPIQIGGEILVVSKVTSGASITLEVETRGDHGTVAQDHVKGATVILLRYSVPHNTIKLDGFLDSGLPLRAVKFLLTGTIGPLGNGIEIDVQLPDSQVKTLRSIQIQLSTTLWPEDLSNVTGLKGIRAQGADGEVVQGGTSLTTQTSLSGLAGKSLYTHEGINLVTGEISFGRCIVIDNVVDNGNGSWTANVAGDWIFRLRFGAEGASRTVNWIVADAWLTPGNTPTWVADNIIEVKNSTGIPGDPLVLNTHRTTIITGANVYARCRLVNWLGVGPWIYWDGVTGSSDRADAVLFKPGTDTTVPSKVTVAVRSIGLNVFINIAPLANVEGYNFFRFYRIKIHLDAARTEELLNITTSEHTQRGGDSAVATNFQVPEAGEYWYEVIPVNLLGDGAATRGSFIVTGLAPALADGVPGVPGVVFKELLQEGLGASFTLNRPTTGHAQIGLYTAVARDNNDFDFVYNDTGFVAALDLNRDEVVATADAFSASSVGKLIELTGIDTGDVSGQRHLLIVTKYVNKRLVKVHKKWWGSSQTGLAARIGDPWWTDSHILWHQSLFVVGPNAVASPIEESFDFAVPIANKTIYVSAFAISIFGQSSWATSPAGVTTSDIGDIVRKHTPSIPSSAPRHALPWTTNIKIRPVDKDTIRWDAGSVKFSDGTSQVVNNTGSPKTLSAARNSGVWYVYKRFNSPALQFTQNFSTAIGTDRIQLGIVVVSVDDDDQATVLIKGDAGGPHISAQSIAVNKLSAIVAYLGEVETGIMTGVLIRTSVDGKRVHISTDDTIDFYNVDGDKAYDIDVIGSHLRIQAVLQNSYISILGGLFVQIGPNLHLGSGGNILGVGNVDLESLSKRGIGAIAVSDDIDMQGNKIINAVIESGTITPTPTDTPTAALTAGVSSLTSPGGSVTLFWTTENAVSASISIGNTVVVTIAADVLVMGDTSVDITGSTTFVLTVVGVSGTSPATASVTIRVTPRPPRRPIIDDFAADDSTIKVGESTTLRWNTTHATTATLDGVDVLVDGSSVVSPIVNTEYVLVATNADGDVTERRTVRVVACDLPTIDSFAADPTSIVRGSSSVLSWTTTDATDVSINKGVGAVLVDSAAGGKSVSPNASITYTLTATNSCGSRTAQVIVTVTDPVVIDTFRATPGTITIGGSTSLSWTTTGAAIVSIDEGVGDQAADGSADVSPTVDTTYILTAYKNADKSGLKITRTVKVTVNPLSDPPTIDTFTSALRTITAGGSTSLTWTTSNAAEVRLDGVIVSADNLFPGKSVSPGDTTTYTLKAYESANRGGRSDTATVRIVVNPLSDPPTIDTFFADPTTIDAGGSSTLEWTTSDALSASINQGEGNQSVDGDTSVSPDDTTTYTLTAYEFANKRGRSVSATAKVTVRAEVIPDPAPTIDTFTSTPTTVTEGGSALLKWTTSNALAVTVNNVDADIDGSLTVRGSLTPPSSKYHIKAFEFANKTGRSVTETLTVTVNPRSDPPTIDTFTATPSRINAGSSSELAWTTSNAAEVYLGSTKVSSDSDKSVSPTRTTTYKLTAYESASKGGRSVSATVKVSIIPLPPPTIDSFVADPTTIDRGDSSELRWTTSNAQSATINNATDVNVDGSLTVRPTATRRYWLKAFENADKTGRSVATSVVVTVTQPPLPTIDEFTIDPTSIAQGESIEIEWETTGATSTKLHSSSEATATVSADGSATRSPTVSTTYYLRVTNVTGSVRSSSIRVVVRAPVELPVIDEFSASPDEARPELGGVTVELSWTTTGATSCSINQGIGTVPVDGSYDVDSIVVSTTWTLTATNSDGSVTRRASIRISG